MSDPKSLSTPIALALFALLLAAPLGAVFVAQNYFEERPLETSAELPPVDPDELPNPLDDGNTGTPDAGTVTSQVFPVSERRELSDDDRTIWLGAIDAAVNDPMTQLDNESDEELLAITFVAGLKHAIQEIGPLPTDPNLEVGVSISRAGVNAFANTNAQATPATLLAVEYAARALIAQNVPADTSAVPYTNTVTGDLSDPEELQAARAHAKTVESAINLLLGDYAQFSADFGNQQNAQLLGTRFANTITSIALANPAGGGGLPDPNGGVNAFSNWTWELAFGASAQGADAIEKAWNDAWSNPEFLTVWAAVMPNCPDAAESGNSCELARAEAAKAIGTVVAGMRNPGEAPQVPNDSDAENVAACVTDASESFQRATHPSARAAVLTGLATALIADPQLAAQEQCPQAQEFAQGVLNTNPLLPSTLATITATIIPQFEDAKRTAEGKLAENGVILPEPEEIAECVSNNVAMRIITRGQAGSAPETAGTGDAYLNMLTGDAVKFVKENGQCPTPFSMDQPSIWVTDCNGKFLSNGMLNGDHNTYLRTSTGCAVTIHGIGDPDMNNTDWSWYVNYTLPGGERKRFAMPLDGDMRKATVPQAVLDNYNDSDAFAFYLEGEILPTVLEGESQQQSPVPTATQRVPYDETLRSFRLDSGRPLVTATAAKEGQDTIRVTWSATDDGSGGPFRYDVEVRQGDGNWVLHLQETEATQELQSWTPGHTYTFRVRARDAVGIWSAWATTMPITIETGGSPVDQLVATFLKPDEEKYEGEIPIQLNVQTDADASPTVCVSIYTWPGKQPALTHAIRCGHLLAFAFDSTQVPDGKYAFRATVTAGGLQSTPWSEPFTISNHGYTGTGNTGSQDGGSGGVSDDVTVNPGTGGTSTTGGNSGTGGSKGPSVYGDDEDDDGTGSSDGNGGGTGSEYTGEGSGTIGADVPFPAPAWMAGVLGAAALLTRGRRNGVRKG